MIVTRAQAERGNVVMLAQRVTAARDKDSYQIVRSLLQECE